MAKKKKVPKNKKAEARPTSKNVLLNNKQRYELLLAEKKIGPLHEYRRMNLYSYVNDKGISRNEQTARKEEIAELLDKKIGGIKGMYTYGTGAAWEWDIIDDYLASKGKFVEQEQILDMIVCYDVIKDKIEKLPKPLKGILKGLSKLDRKQLSLVEVIVNHAIKLNESDDLL